MVQSAVMKRQIQPANLSGPLTMPIEVHWSGALIGPSGSYATMQPRKTRYREITDKGARHELYTRTGKIVFQTGDPSEMPYVV